MSLKDKKLFTKVVIAQRPTEEMNNQGLFKNVKMDEGQGKKRADVQK